MTGRLAGGALTRPGQCVDVLYSLSLSIYIYLHIYTHTNICVHECMCI